MVARADPMAALPSSLPTGASHLYMCLSKKHRVSRSFRATWFLGYLDQNLPHDLFLTEDDEGDQSKDLSVLSMSEPHYISSDTNLFFACWQYSLVFVVDLSDNMRTVSNWTHSVKMDSALAALYALLTLLTRNFRAPGNPVLLEPTLCVTVLVYCGSATKAIHILLQGIFMTNSNCSEILEKLKLDMTSLECRLAEEGQGCPADTESGEHRTPGSLVGDCSLEGMFKAGMLAIQLLPRCALKGLVLLTDGVSGFSTPLSMHNTVNAMRADALGLITDMETIFFIAQACNGCVVSTDKVQEALLSADDADHTPNVVQRAILFWTFQKSALAERVKGVSYEGWEGCKDPFAPIISRGYTRSTIHTPLLCLVGSKIREGFFLNTVQIRESSMDISLYYPWQASVNIYYTITAPWPVSEGCVSLQASTSYDGPYSFVHDIQCELNSPTTSSHRITSVRKFKQALQKFSNSDALLAHFLTFPTTPSYHTLPQSVLDGMPLLHFPPNQTKPAPSIDISSSGGKVHIPLVNFWRPLCTIDTSQWFHWFHSDKVVLVLHPSSVLPTHLLHPSPSGRYATIQCRLTASHLYNFLKSWSSMVLLDNHSYIRFLPNTGTPKYFCLIRMGHVLPCVVLHVGHIQGTPHCLQSQTVISLLDSIRELTVTVNERPLGGIGRKRTSAIARPKPSATVIDKQLQRVLIRYDPSVPIGSGSSMPNLTQAEGSVERLVQMDYLSCTRWLWKSSKTTPTVLLALLRRRLKEGFLLSGSKNGVVTLIAQVDMQQQYTPDKQHLLLQYVLFPYSALPTTELWVEPQYGHVCATPSGLLYLNGSKHSDIVDKVHEVDKDLVTSVTTFFYLQSCSRGQPKTDPPSIHHLSQSHDLRNMSCDLVSCQIDNKPDSLYNSSRAVFLTLEAFTEDSGQTVLDLNSCSHLNSKLWKHLCAWLSNMAPTQVTTLTDPHSLLTRITSSRTMIELASMCQLLASTHVRWQGYVMSREENSVVQICVPNVFHRSRESESCYILPLVILECELSVLIDPDPAQKEVPVRQSDVCIHWPLSTSHPVKVFGSSLTYFLSGLSNAHVLAYLEVMHKSLLQNCQVSQAEVMAGLQVCSRGKLTVDFTPLVAALCSHSAVTLPEETTPTTTPLSTSALCTLLKGVVSRMNWRCSVSRPAEGWSDVELSHCSLWRKEVLAAFLNIISMSHFVPIPSCHGYYYWAESDHHPINTAASEHKVSPANETSRPATSNDIITVTPPLKDDLTSDPNESTNVTTEGSGIESGSEEMDIDPLLFSDSSDEEDSRDHTHQPSQTHPPLFLHVDFSVKSKATATVHSVSESLYSIDAHHCQLPLCIKSIVSDDDSYFIAMDLTFMSFTQVAMQESRSEVTNLPETESGSVVYADSASTLSVLPVKHQATANSIKQKMEWLISDELVSICRKTTPIDRPLLQAVATHVHTSYSATNKCFSRKVPLKFVLGHNHSMEHFLFELEALQLPGYKSLKTGKAGETGDYYYYLIPEPHPPNIVVSKTLAPHPECRSKTPPPIAVQPRSRVHRRSSSSCYPQGHTPNSSRSSMAPNCTVCSPDGSMSLVGSDYDASVSCSVSSLSEVIGSPERLVSSVEDGFWIIIRPLTEVVEICFQFRSSRRNADNVLSNLISVFGDLERGVTGVCHRTNQYFLLKEMLVTRMCSPYLLSVSASGAWVDDVVSKQAKEGGRSGLIEGEDGFRGQQFVCNLQWKRHITPHWRLKAMKTSRAALLITRTALDAFSVSNRRDVYVIQDINWNGEESIFYLKVDESLCQVEEESGLDESVTTTESVPQEGSRWEGRGMAEATDTMSTISMQPSISEPVPDLERRALPLSVDAASSLHTNLFQKPQESLVLQLHGITTPSLDLRERLYHVVQFKLDDIVLDLMCSLYARNQKLKLYPADIQFLQPSISEPSHILSIPIPTWIGQVEALVFYFLQNLTCFTFQPNYTSLNHKDHFQIPLALQNAYLTETSDQSHDIYQDHVFLYIRPHTKGRGMAVICVSLVSPEGRVITPIPGLVLPSKDKCPIDLENSGVVELSCPITEMQGELTDHYSLKFYIWEKGNIGLTDFMQKLVMCFKHSLSDYILELHLLPSPVATPLSDKESSRDSQVSPFVMVEDPHVPNQPHRGSNASQDDLETVVEEGTTFGVIVGPSRKISRDSRRSSGDVSRKSSGDVSRRSSGDVSRRGSGDTSRRGSVDQGKLKREDKKSSSAPKDLAMFDRTVVDMEAITIGNQSESTFKRLRTFTEKVIEEMDDAVHVEQQGASKSWVENESQRRKMEFLKGQRLKAHFGECGHLERTYIDVVPSHLASAVTLKCSSIKHQTFRVLGTYSSKVFLSQMLSTVRSLCPDLSVSTFSRTASGQAVHYEPDPDWTKVSRHVANKMTETCYILIGRNLEQFKESLDPVTRSTMPWLDLQTKQPLQMFQPLDCRKIMKGAQVPLQHMPIATESFVPRQRLILVMVTGQQADAWLYNFHGESTKRILEKLRRISEWQAARSGLVLHLLCQKMGLFQHTQACDIQDCTKLALKHSASIQEVTHLVKSNALVSKEVELPRFRLLHRQVTITDTPLIDTLYQNAFPQSSLSITEDPVFNHGQQFRNAYKTQKLVYKTQELLGKVFQSWRSHSGLSGAPVNPDTIDTVKRMARLFHFCSSPVLVEECLPKSKGQSSEDKVKSWCDMVKEQALSQYILYQQSLGFQAITERSITPSSKARPPLTTHHSQPASPKLYKCLQRSWTGGIILVELCYQGNNFLVKLYTLELSRLVNQSPLTPECQTNFSVECACYKDFIHVHSFMYDFHLQLLLKILNNTYTPPDSFDLCRYIGLCHQLSPPHYIRHLLQKGVLDIATPSKSVAPQVLYQYLLVHCSEFSGQTLELKVGGNASSELSSLNVGLLINVCSKSLGLTTSPQLSKLINETQANYSTCIVVVPSDYSEHILNLSYYLLLVHKFDQFPRLTRDSPDLRPTCHALPSGLLDTDFEDVNKESELNIKVREHRRKMGFGSLTTPSLASQIVLNQLLIEEHLKGVKSHLNEVGQEALCHMRRDVLWKRLLYGQVRSQYDTPSGAVSSPLEGLSCSEFRELIHFVTLVPIDEFDPKLAPLKKQPRKWFKKLLRPLEVRFADNIKIFETEDDTFRAAAIINTEWHDMLVLVLVDRDVKQLAAVYRKPKEGGVPTKERLITANLEAERQHIETVINFICSFLWASILDTSPPQPHLSLL